MSASSERIFSKAGFITAKQRNCLKAKNVEAIIFLNKNSDYGTELMQRHTREYSTREYSTRECAPYVALVKLCE